MFTYEVIYERVETRRVYITADSPDATLVKFNEMNEAGKLAEIGVDPGSSLMSLETRDAWIRGTVPS